MTKLIARKCDELDIISVFYFEVWSLVKIAHGLVFRKHLPLYRDSRSANWDVKAHFDAVLITITTLFLYMDRSCCFPLSNTNQRLLLTGF